LPSTFSLPLTATSLRRNHSGEGEVGLRLRLQMDHDWCLQCDSRVNNLHGGAYCSQDCLNRAIASNRFSRPPVATVHRKRRGPTSSNWVDKLGRHRDSLSGHTDLESIWTPTNTSTEDYSVPQTSFAEEDVLKNASETTTIGSSFQSRVILNLDDPFHYSLNHLTSRTLPNFHSNHRDPSRDRPFTLPNNQDLTHTRNMSSRRLNLLRDRFFDSDESDSNSRLTYQYRSALSNVPR